VTSLFASSIDVEGTALFNGPAGSGKVLPSFDSTRLKYLSSAITTLAVLVCHTNVDFTLIPTTAFKFFLARKVHKKIFATPTWIAKFANVFFREPFPLYGI